MNGHVNCILGVCCPPGSEAQAQALADEMEADGMMQALPEGERKTGVLSIAKWVLKNFDLAPHGSLQPFKDEIARLARENRPAAQGEGL